jgi:hypothetical protein
VASVCYNKRILYFLYDLHDFPSISESQGPTKSCPFGVPVKHFFRECAWLMAER